MNGQVHFYTEADANYKNGRTAIAIYGIIKTTIYLQTDGGS